MSAEQSPAIHARRLFRDVREALRRTVADWSELLSPLTAPVGRVLACVSATGWSVLVAALGCAVGLRLLGWQELGYAASALVVLFALSCLLTIGRTQLDVTTVLDPTRVGVGSPSILRVAVRNPGRRPVLPSTLDLPTGQGVTRFALSALGHAATWEEVLVMPTDRRGVLVVGPAVTRRGDPFGIVARQVALTEPTELIVWPRLVGLQPLESGLLKDLEGHTTSHISASDLSFHTLREYAPGDDRRHIHWASSAKRSSLSGLDTFLVRQFVDTRRSHIGVALDTRTSSYTEDDEFELAVSVAASVARRAQQDGQDLSHAAGDAVVTLPSRATGLDLYARVSPGEASLEAVAARLTRRAPGISAALLVVGPLTPFTSVHRAARLFGPSVNVVGVRVEAGSPPTVHRAGGTTVVSVGSLPDLPAALSGRVSTS